MLIRAAALNVQLRAQSAGESPRSTESDEVVVIDDIDHSLDVEQVTMWLTTCCADDRQAIAAALAPDIEELRQQAAEESRDRGFAEGAEAGESKWLSACAALEVVAEGIAGKHEADFAELTDNCGEIVAESIGKIIGSLMATDEAIIGSVEQVLARIREDGDVVVRVHRDQVDFIRSKKHCLADIVGGRVIAIQADPRIELGGCIVETAMGSLDGRIDVQLRQLFETLRTATKKRIES